MMSTKNMPPKTHIEENPHYKILSITLLSFQLKDENIQDIQQYQDSNKINYDIALGHNHSISDNNIFVILNCNINIKIENTTFRQIECSYIGHFKVENPDKFPQLSPQIFAEKNAPAIIYPYLRQFINYITYQMGLPPLTLPIIMIHSK